MHPTTSSSMASSRARRRAFAQVDVFGQHSATGNPVAVVLDASNLDDDAMRRLSAWTNLSECTFVLPPDQPGADYRVRIFSLNTELPFAGHPTLGTARAWLASGGVPARPGVVIQQCAAGLITVDVDDDDVLHFTAPARTRTGPVEEEHLDAVAAVLGIAREEVVDAEWLDNGPGWVGVLLADGAAVRRLRPDASRFPGRWDIGVLGLQPPGADTALEVRAFFTEGDTPLREDPVTGSLNAAAAEWLIATGRLTAPYTAAQGEVVGRQGRVQVSCSGGRVRVGGRAHVVITGEVML